MAEAVELESSLAELPVRSASIAQRNQFLGFEYNFN
jgi:hypothetical protein